MARARLQKTRVSPAQTCESAPQLAHNTHVRDSHASRRCRSCLLLGEQHRSHERDNGPQPPQQLATKSPTSTVFEVVFVPDSS